VHRLRLGGIVVGGMGVVMGVMVGGMGGMGGGMGMMSVRVEPPSQGPASAYMEKKSN